MGKAELVCAKCVGRKCLCIFSQAVLKETQLFKQGSYGNNADFLHLSTMLVGHSTGASKFFFSFHCVHPRSSSTNSFPRAGWNEKWNPLFTRIQISSPFVLLLLLYVARRRDCPRREKHNTLEEIHRVCFTNFSF
jgi:hypothetical protein